MQRPRTNPFDKSNINVVYPRRTFVRLMLASYVFGFCVGVLAGLVAWGLS